MEIFLQPDTWVALLTLTFLEIILGIDNIIFISITTSKLPKESQKERLILVYYWQWYLEYFYCLVYPI